MTLKLYYHPLSSFSHKVLIALYENGTPFEADQLNSLSTPEGQAEFKAKWPVGKFPLLEDGPGKFIPESSVIIEYLDLHYPGRTKFIPSDPDLALAARLSDRFLDTYLHYPMQRIVGNVLRPEGSKDPLAVEESVAMIELAYAMSEKKMEDGRTWAMGDAFSIVDCAAGPPLFYCNKIVPLGPQTKLAAYLERLMARPSYARALKEAEPFMGNFPVKHPLK